MGLGPSRNDIRKWDSATPSGVAPFYKAVVEQGLVPEFSAHNTSVNGVQRQQRLGG